MSESTHHDVIVLGAGVSGIYQIKRLTVLGVDAIVLEADDDRLILRDADGSIRFSADFVNASDVKAMLEELVGEYGATVTEARDAILELYESVFNHKAFTGRSGTMFGFEGLGSIYWHMVAKLLLGSRDCLK